MTLYYYMFRSWQDCCRRGENRSWPSVSVESVDSECWCLNNAIVYAFIMQLTVEERVLRSTFKLNILYYNIGPPSFMRSVVDRNVVIGAWMILVNRLKPNDPYMGRTEPLTSKRFILYIYSTNIGTEYFKHALYSPFFLLKMQFVS